jgi:hypothetical protein
MKTLLFLFILLIFQDAFEGSGTITADGFVPDGKKEAVKLETKETFEGRVWIKGTLAKGVLQVAEFERLPKQLGKGAEGKAFSATITEVYPWCDHMPGAGQPAKRQYLIISLTLSNKTDKALEVGLARAMFSFDAATEGPSVTGLSVRGESGMGTGETKIKLAANETKELQLRGDGLFPEGSEGKTLHTTLVLSGGGDRLIARDGGAVSKTQ